MKKKKDNTKILLAIPSHLKFELEQEAKKETRSLNNYILWLLINRKES